MMAAQQHRSLFFARAAIVGIYSWAFFIGAAPYARGAANVEEVIVRNQRGVMNEKEGEVRFQPGTQAELPASPPQGLSFGDGLRTLELARASIGLSDLSTLRMKSSTRLLIVPRTGATNVAGLRFLSGQGYISSRGAPRAVSIETPHAKGLAKGTEFLVNVDLQANQTEITMLDGELELSNTVDTKTVRSGEQGIAAPGLPIVIRPILRANNIVQWWIYYPGLLDPNELGLTVAEEAQLVGSLQAYRSGDLQAALQRYPGYPTPADPASDAQRVYLAGLFLAVGAVDRTEAQLTLVASNAPLANALRTMIRAVGLGASRLTSPAREPGGSVKVTGPTTSSEFLALSYQHQSTNNLSAALQTARAAVDRSPNFGFGWARVAELEFSFGHTREAHHAAERAIKLTPRNAQAHALDGFLFAAENHMSEAVAAFNRAMEIDPALGNAWLGRGLCRIRLGQSRAGRLDIQTAAILEPSRSLVRSYAGKAFGDSADTRLAKKELAFARKLDPNDPTPWLYSALEKWEENRVNDAVDDLEQSIALNDNRALFRSRLLLDQDRAVRSASLAKIYLRAGLEDVSVRGAARAVGYDYGNYSAHLFLSESFDALRDPTRFNLRYETPWFNELLLANLLAPVGATPLSQQIAQQEYSRLFERERIGISTDSSYRSDGQVRELASQFGWFGNTAWSLDLDYQHNDGVRPNNSLSRIEWYSTIKQQLSARDSVMLLTKYQDYHSGDNFQYYDPTNARPYFKFDEYQTPIVFGGYHHEWAPGIHSLLLAGRIENDQRFSDRNAPGALLYRDTQIDPSGPIVLADRVNLDVDHRTTLEIYSAEAQQVFDWPAQTFVAGGRWQGGQFDTQSRMSNPSAFASDFATPPADVHAVDDFERVSAYGYETLKLPGRLRITGGLTYEHLRFPRNFRSPPIQSGEDVREKFEPKASVVWNPLSPVTLRGIYARALGGVSLDESFRLEPTQLAGFVQDFRSVIPESLVGSVSAPEHEVWGIALDVKLKTRTYVGLAGELLRSKVDQTVGVFDYFFASPTTPRIFPSSTSQRLRYREQSLALTLNQLLSEEWSVGAQYRFTRSRLDSTFPELADLPASADSSNRAQLQTVRLFLLFNHPSGFFAEGESNWYLQRNFGSAANLPGDSFEELNAFVGYRFPRLHGDITLGILNITGQDYRLNPVTPYAELPRERVFYARLRMRF